MSISSILQLQNFSFISLTRITTDLILIFVLHKSEVTLSPSYELCSVAQNFLSSNFNFAYHLSSNSHIIFFLSNSLREIGLDNLLKRGIKNMEVSVAEAPLQLATYACDLPTDEDGLLAIETTSLRKPRPCLMKSDEIDADDEEE